MLVLFLRHFYGWRLLIGICALFVDAIDALSYLILVLYSLGVVILAILVNSGAWRRNKEGINMHDQPVLFLVVIRDF
jgi:hypothetical protein